ncbi:MULTISPECIES: hypothetical protein [unclassified Microcoleus]|uniref:hypothetical protein n=1 Tax=unclassified Microcoleus TaxID=2642155 RepID=UPI002FD1E5D4
MVGKQQRSGSDSTLDPIVNPNYLSVSRHPGTLSDPANPHPVDRMKSLLPLIFVLAIGSGFYPEQRPPERGEGWYHQKQGPASYQQRPVIATG